MRKNPNLDSVTLVALTGFGQEEDRQRSKAAGFNEHLVKPTSLDLLREVIKRVAAGKTDMTNDRSSPTPDNVIG